MFLIMDIRAGRAFLQALRVTRARVLSFPLCVPACFFKAFFWRTKIRVPNFVTRSRFACLKKKFEGDIMPNATLTRMWVMI